MLFLWGLGGKAGFDINAAKATEPTGRDLSAGIISFGGIVFGSFSGVIFFHVYCGWIQLTQVCSWDYQWAPVAADYNCRLPVETSSYRVFILTFFGLWIRKSAHSLALI